MSVHRLSFFCAVLQSGEWDSKTTTSTTLRDAEREPRIKECQPIKGFTDEHEGYMLYDKANGYAYRFFDPDTRFCKIYETHPLCCRLFDCSSYEHRAT